MSGHRPVAVCVLLAVAAHAAVLGWSLASRPGQASSPASGAGPLQTRLMQTPPVPAVPAEEAAAPSPAPPEQPAQELPPTLQSAMSGSDGSDAAAPRFAESPAEIGMPDAPLPEGGVQVRAFLRLDEAGHPTDIAMATWPAAAARAFGDQFKRALEASRFEPESTHARRCLQMDFEADASQPRWSWVPEGQAGAARCLDVRAGAAKALTPP